MGQISAKISRRKVYLKTDACIGDRFRIGEASVKVTQPRFPCYKLGIRFGRDDIIETILDSRRSGIYFAVLEEGVVNTGDAIERVHEDDRRLTIADINRAYDLTREKTPLLRRIVSLEILPRGLHDDFAEQLSLLDQ